MLNKFFQEIEKDECDKNCPFKQKKDRPIIIIPPPKKPSIMIISRDPTMSFLPLYNYSKNNYKDDEIQRLMLFSGAIPQRLLMKINQFLTRTNNKKPIKDFYKLFDIAYWTHLHKCPTDDKSTFEKYCADKWLIKEITEAIDSGIKVIITLGKDVRNWIDQRREFLENNNIKIINLYHPSGIVAKWYDVSSYNEIDKALSELLKLINSITKESL